MTGLSGGNGMAHRSDPWDSRLDPGRGGYDDAREGSIASDGGTLENPYDDPSRAPVPQPSAVPTRHTTLSSRSQYDEYSDPYYHGAKLPQ
jgi:hypothetical protein